MAESGPPHSWRSTSLPLLFLLYLMLLFSERVSESRWGNSGLPCNKIISKYCAWRTDWDMPPSLYWVTPITITYISDKIPYLPAPHLGSFQFMLLHTTFHTFRWPHVKDKTGIISGTRDICESETPEATLCCGFSECHFNDNQHIIKNTIAYISVVLHVKHLN